MTKGFTDFVNKLIVRQELDRVVIDECHIVLDSLSEFRPKLLELGKVVGDWGVQILFLTATLPPKDMDEFRTIMCLDIMSVSIFRDCTTRKNLSYSVVRFQGKAEGIQILRN